MAFRETTVDELEFLANSFQEISDRLFAVVKKMREESMLTLMLQIDAVQTHYLPPCERLAADIDMHFRDQLRCSKIGGTPQWQRSVQKAAYNKAQRDAKAERVSKQIEPGHPKKVAKKSGKNGK